MYHTNDAVTGQMGLEATNESPVARRPALTLEVDVLEARIAPGQPVFEFVGPFNLGPQNAVLPAHGGEIELL